MIFLSKIFCKTKEHQFLGYFSIRLWKSHESGFWHINPHAKHYRIPNQPSTNSLLGQPAVFLQLGQDDHVPVRLAGLRDLPDAQPESAEQADLLAGQRESNVQPDTCCVIINFLVTSIKDHKTLFLIIYWSRLFLKKDCTIS